MKIVLVNESTLAGKDLNEALLNRIASALARQQNESYAAMWQAQGCPIGTAANLASVPKDNSAVMAILDNADQAGALGYHDTTPDGRPYGKVFLEPILSNGGKLISGEVSLSATLSHECLEMVGDPYCCWWSQNLKDGKLYCLELGDPVEADSYTIDDVAVSNFVGPRYFSQGPGPYDYMGKLKEPFTMTVGGYLIVMDQSGNVSQIFGENYPEWKKDTKKHQASRTFKRMNSLIDAVKVG